MSPINTELIVCILSYCQVKLNIDNKIQLYDNAIIMDKDKFLKYLFSEKRQKMNEIQHKAERKAFEIVLKKIVRKGKNESASQMAESILKIMKGILGDSWKESSYAVFQEIADNPDSKWARYVDRLISEADPDIITTFLTNAAYEGGFRGYKTTEEMAEKYDCNVPWLILMDPTSACNLHCIGCWAAEYGYKQNLSFEVMDRTISEAKELGT